MEQSMNWEAIGAIGEILGALAVVLTLGYLAVQVRHTRLAAADASRQARADGVREISTAIGHNEDLAELLFKAQGAESVYEEIGQSLDMSAFDSYRVDWINISLVWTHWGQWAGLKTPEDIAELKHIIGEFYTVPPVSITWDKSPLCKNLLDENFVRFVDEILKEKRQTD